MVHRGSTRHAADTACDHARLGRGLHEAVVNYGNNTKPEVITGNHEEIGVAMAHGYAKMEGKPMVDVSRRTCFTTNARAISRVTSTTPFDPLTNFG